MQTPYLIKGFSRIYKESSKLNNKKTNSLIKKWAKCQTDASGKKHTDDKHLKKKMFLHIRHQGNTNQRNKRFYYTPTGMAKTQNADSTKGWQGHEEQKLVHHWECRTAQPLGKTVWCFLTKLSTGFYRVIQHSCFLVFTQ